MAIPTLRGTDHIGFTVPDLEQATRFFVDIIGCEYFYSMGPYQSDGDWMSSHLNVHPRAKIRELRFFRCEFGSNFEIFYYESPDGQAAQPKNSDIGGHHLCFYVDDLDEAVSYLKANGVEVLGEPTASSGPHLGQRWVYFLSPWGMQLELCSYPNGKAYEKDSPKRLWDPRDPAR